MNSNSLILRTAIFVVLILLFVLWKRKSEGPNSGSAVPSPNGSNSLVLGTQAELDAATKKVSEKDATGAIILMRGAVDRVEKAGGRNSPPHAAALYNLAKIYLVAGDFDSAVTTLERACEVIPTDRQSQKDRLTYQMNLGSILIRMQKFSQAEKVLRGSLVEREKLYGTEHAGYAYGLEPLAELLLTQNRPVEALQLITRTRDICLLSPTPLTPEAFAIRAFAVVAAGENSTGVWDRIERLTNDERLKMYAIIIQRSSDLSGTHVFPTLELAQQRIEADPVASFELKLRIGEALINEARRENNATRWLAAIDRLMPQIERSSNRQMLVDLMQSKAEAYESAGKFELVKTSYNSAVKEAMSLNDTSVISGVQRNYALYLSNNNEKDASVPHFEAAVAYGRKSGNKDRLGSALAAQGIFVQHNGDLKRATGMLEESVACMSPTHEHYLYALNHLNAIRLNQSCGCGNMQDTISETIKRIIRERIPADLIKDIVVKPTLDGEPNVDVKLARSATPVEIENVNLVVRQAIVELRKSIKAK